MFSALVGGVGAATGVVAAATYAAMDPRSQLFGKTFRHGNNDRQIALTYDDGPNERDTPQLLEVLAKHSARASFFVIGKFVNARPDIIRDILKCGHAVGNHTFSHYNLLWMKPGMIAKEIDDCQKAIEDAAGNGPTLFRPPFGFRRPAVIRAAQVRRLLPVMWSATCFDWKEKTAEAIAGFAGDDIDKSGFGSVVLLHDGDHLEMGADRGLTVRATELILNKYGERGYKFVTIPQMLDA